MPGTPKSPPPKITLNIMNIAEIPTELPKILGPIMFPSICCKISMKIENQRALMGLMTSKISMQGIAPRNGPKNGIILVLLYF